MRRWSKRWPEVSWIATAILEARQADRPEEAPVDLDAAQSVDAASDPEVPTSPDAWSWAEVAFIGGTLGDMPALEALRALDLPKARFSGCTPAFTRPTTWPGLKWCSIGLMTTS